jgi:tetratricopeptide (TPR) repeat protein
MGEFSVHNPVELAALTRMLELAQGFTLGFARINHPSLRERLVREIRRRFPRKRIAEVTLDRGAAGGVVTQLEKALGEERPEALFVYGLEGMFDLQVEQSPAMDILNLNRNYCGKRFPWPVVFWLPEFAMRELSRQAPDVWAWRSGTYYFIGEEEDARQTLGRLEEGFGWSLSLREKRERREILQHVLAELEKSGQPDSRVLAKVLERLGNAAHFEGESAGSEGYYPKALGVYRQLGDKLGEANCVQALGEVALSQARYEEAGRLYSQALPIHRQISDRRGEANCLLSVGRLARITGDTATMVQAFTEAERIYRSIGLTDWAERVHDAAAVPVA